MIRNPIERFQEFWRTLEPEDQGDLYFLLSAIRGPDLSENFSLKERYTMPIRKLLFDNRYGHASKHMVVGPSDHFIAHAQIAESILNHHGFKKDEIELSDGTRIPRGGWTINTNQQTPERRQAVVPLPKISIPGYEAEVDVHLRLVAARERRDPFRS